MLQQFFKEDRQNLVTAALTTAIAYACAGAVWLVIMYFGVLA